MKKPLKIPVYKVTGIKPWDQYFSLGIEGIWKGNKRARAEFVRLTNEMYEAPSPLYERLVKETSRGR